MLSIKYLQRLISIFEESGISSLEVKGFGNGLKITNFSRLSEYVEIPPKKKEDIRSIEGRVKYG